ncbi:MAG TPA: hypothetical protein VGZ26_10940 [Pirellulales bacterium]|nr:hypothetical protein [Pirellulales bacterium]
MSRLSKLAALAVGVLVLVGRVESFAAVPPAENLLPSSTKGFLAVPSVDELKESWNLTQLGQLLQDPAMQPFLESFKQQIQQKWTQTHQKLGIGWQDLDGVPSGEVAIALIAPSATEVYAAVVADVTGHQDQTNALLEKINQNMAAQKAVRSQRTISGVGITVFEIPKHEDNPARQMAYFVKDDLLAASDSLKVIEGILARQTQAKADSLAQVVAFEAITKRCREAAGDLAPQVRWFVEPFGYVEAIRLANADPEHPRRKQTDMLKILKNQGFTAVQGIGGFLNFMHAPYEILHRSFAFAPGNQSGVGERFSLSARMLDFPNADNLATPAWVPREVASYATLNVNVKNGFEASKTIVNEIVGDEVFEDVLDSIRNDPDGPKIDIRRDLIAYLGNRVTIISDLQLPVTPKSERMLFAVETNNPTQLAAAIEKSMKTDPDAKRREINGHVVWEIVDEQSALPMVTIENSPTFGGVGGATADEPEERPMLPNSAVTVAHGQFFVATHIDILANVLANIEEREQLVNDSEFRRSHQEIAKLARSSQFAQTFSRTDDAYRGVYELLRMGRMPEAESMLGKILNSILGEGKEGVLRTQRIDGSKLPEYDLVRRYFGPAGMTATTEADGWFLTGFVLNKEVQAEDAAK